MPLYVLNVVDVVNVNVVKCCECCFGLVLCWDYQEEKTPVSDESGSLLGLSGRENSCL